MNFGGKIDEDAELPGGDAWVDLEYIIGPNFDFDKE